MTVLADIDWQDYAEDCAAHDEAHARIVLDEMHTLISEQDCGA